MRGEFPLATTRELPSRHALAACGSHAVKAYSSPGEAEEQRVVAQLEGPCGE
jgi:hypothetical protein